MRQLRGSDVVIALCCSVIACASVEAGQARRPQPAEIKEITIDRGPVVVDGSVQIRGNGWNVTPEMVKEAVLSYHVVSGKRWLHNYSHVAGMDRTGLLILIDGTTLRWMMKPGGLAWLRYPNGYWIYLAYELTDDQPEDPWIPTTWPGSSESQEQ